MYKRFSIITSVVLVASILSGLTAEGSNFSTGALLNSQWTCIKAWPSTSERLSDTKVAELEFAPTTVKRDKSSTTVTFTKFNLKSSKGLYTAVSLAVFNQTKTYKRSFIPLKPLDGVQKINFKVKVPTKEIKDIVLNISIQDPKNRKVGAACIPTSVYQEFLPVTQLSFDSSQTNEPISNLNPVLTKINKIIPQLEIPKETVAPPVEWKSPAGSNVERLESLKQQHQRLSNAFPSLYFWEKSALAVVSPDATWLRVEMENAGCQGGVIEFLRRLEADKNLIGAGTSVCRGRLAAFFLDKNMTDLMWSNLVGSEFGGAIQENSFKKSPSFKSGNFNWYSSAPGWYAEGGKTVLSVIASTKVSRSWTHQGRQLAQVSSYCFDDTLIDFKCAAIGEAGVELLIALYGWDSAFIWFENFDTSKSDEISFMETFKDPYEKFQEWALTYYRYVTKGESLPKDLLDRLES